MPDGIAEYHRQTIDRIITKSLADQQFRERLISDPGKVLVEAGVPALATEDVSWELGLLPGVPGQNGSVERPCVGITCWWSCSKTCQITFNGQPHGTGG